MEPTQGRWVCRRCFASNEADATNCEQCGLERGADPSAAGPPDPQQPQWTATPSPPARPVWLQLALRFWWIGLIAVVAVGGWYFSARRDESGQIANSGNLQVTDLRIGDCFDLKDPEANEVDDVEAMPCTRSHQYELFHIANMASGGYPSDDAISTFLDQECVPAFAAYIGMEYQASLLEVVYFTPTSGGWDDGDHSVQCAAYDPKDAELAESLRSSAR